MYRCQWCGKNSSGYGMVVLTIKEDEPSQSICEDCYNRYMADILGVEDYKDYEKEATFTDCDGIEHCFQIRKKIHPTGICWQAVEFIGVDKVGYSFEVHQDFEEDSNDALKRLYKKIRKGLSQKFIKREVFQGHELISLKGNIVEGRIEWDDRYDDRTPKFIIDGQEYSLEEFGRMMMSCEGWNLYDNAGNLLASNDDSNGTLYSTINYNVIVGRTYIVKVTGYNNSAVKCTLTVQ